MTSYLPKDLMKKLNEPLAGDREKALDGDWGARFRQDVLNPYAKLLAEYMHRTMKTEEFDVNDEAFLDCVVLSAATIPGLYSDLITDMGGYTKAQRGQLQDLLISRIGKAMREMSVHARGSKNGGT